MNSTLITVKTALIKLNSALYRAIQTKGQSGLRWLMIGFVVSLLLGFAITWLVIQPEQSDHLSPDLAQTNPRITGEQSEAIAANIAIAIANQTQRKVQSAIQPVSDKVVPDRGWSADTFLNVLNKPHTARGPVGDRSITQRRAEQPRKDPYLQSLLDEAIDLVVVKGRTEQTKDQSDQALFEPIPTSESPGGSQGPANEEGSSMDRGEVEPSDNLFLVQDGDSLYKIALKLYGDGGQYQKIYKENKDQLKNPNRLSTGTWLRIPDLP